MKTMPNEPRHCPIHGEEVIVSREDFGSSSSAGPPFEAVFIGCCDEAIQKEFEFINKTCGLDDSSE
jgi:hypothetical protein